MIKLFHDHEVVTDLNKTAKLQSMREGGVWYVMKHPSRNDVVVSENDLSRYMRLGYKTECCYYEGSQYKNAYWDQSIMRYHFINMPRG